MPTVWSNVALEVVPATNSDDELLTALEYAQGDDRVLLVGALGDAHGGRGPAVLMCLAAHESGEGGLLRAAAIGALARRSGAAATPTYLRGLRDRSVPVQQAAAEALAEYGDGSATTEMLAWLGRRLRRKARLANFDPDEVRSALRFADRNGALREVASALDAHRDRLHPDERGWLPSGRLTERPGPVRFDHARGFHAHVRRTRC